MSIKARVSTSSFRLLVLFFFLLTIGRILIYIHKFWKYKQHKTNLVLESNVRFVEAVSNYYFIISVRSLLLWQHSNVDVDAFLRLEERYLFFLSK